MPSKKRHATPNGVRCDGTEASAASGYPNHKGSQTGHEAIVPEDSFSLLQWPGVLSVHRASGPALSPSSLVGTPTLSSMLNSRFPIGVGSAYLM